VAIAKTRYAKADGVNIAYQVIGDGPIDLVYIPGFVSHVELSWEEPLYARFLDRLASFSRLIVFDKRGTGMSDRVSRDELPSLEQRLDDLHAVLDAVGSTSAALLSQSEGGNMAILETATNPARVSALVTIGIFAKRVWSEDYPWAPTPERREEEIAAVEEHWGEVETILDYAPSLAENRPVLERIARLLQRCASPADAAQLYRINSLIDTRDVLPTIQVPTLMIHRTGDRDANIDEGRWISQQIPGARFVELPGEDHFAWVGDSDSILDLIQEFLTGAKGSDATDRVLSTVMCTDIVGSTRRAEEMGDRAWLGVLDRHDRLARTHIEQHRGRLVKLTGDGVLALFDGPARAVKCAAQLSEALAAEGVETRSGVHTGEVELRGEDVAGIAVHVATRVMQEASAGEVLVSQTVIDLVSGSGLRFSARGAHQLKGVDAPVSLSAVVT
jgi:class 3 adenylate cyclase